MLIMIDNSICIATLMVDITEQKKKERSRPMSALVCADQLTSIRYCVQEVRAWPFQSRTHQNFPADTASQRSPSFAYVCRDRPAISTCSMPI